MAKRKKKKVKQEPGTWFLRKMLQAPAYFALSKTAYPILGLIFLKRQFGAGWVVINKNDITVTYKELEALGMKGKTTIANGFTSLMAHGFIKVISQGGAYQGEKTVYGLADEWEYWKPGDEPVRVREKGKQLGSDALKRHRESKKEELKKEEE